MSVYVDAAVLEWRGRLWCHMTADTDAELHAMARRLGLARRWAQIRAARPWNAHYDLPAHVRERAMVLGAVPISADESITLRRAKREAALAAHGLQPDPTSHRPVDRIGSSRTGSYRAVSPRRAPGWRP